MRNAQIHFLRGKFKVTFTERMSGAYKWYRRLNAVIPVVCNNWENIMATNLHNFVIEVTTWRLRISWGKREYYFACKVWPSVGFKVFTAVTMNNAVFWDVAPCRSYVNRRFGGTYRLHLQGSLQSAATCSRWFLARGVLYPEDGGDTFFRNVDSNKIYMVPHPRRRHSSYDFLNSNSA
jgi:hypothetical protein